MLMTWKVKTLNAKVDEELTALPEDTRAPFYKIAQSGCLSH